MEILERAHMVGCTPSRTPVDTESKLGDGDADWAGCPTMRQSTSGYCFFLGKNLLSWSSKRQPTLSHSSDEAQYRGVANAVAETYSIRNLHREFHTPLSFATIVYCDNLVVNDVKVHDSNDMVLLVIVVSRCCLRSWWSCSQNMVQVYGLVWERESKPLEKINYTSDHDSEDEVEPVDNEMASILASKPSRVGYGTNGLLEQ
nr:ribonuclease H-like domain-containing protein [Tanacetum cinerariifolium]